MADVFISYAQGDREWVKTFATALEAEGFSVWWDPNLLPGSRFREIIKIEMNEAKAVIVVWSRLSIQSDWVLGEADEARTLRKLIPVLSESVRPPTEFRTLHTADLSQWRGQREHPAFVLLVKGLRVLVGAGTAGAPQDALPASDSDAKPTPLQPPPEQMQIDSLPAPRRLLPRITLFVLLAVLGLGGVAVGITIVRQYFQSDEWTPSLRAHVAAALTSADEYTQQGADAAKTALDAQSDLNAKAAPIVVQAKDAEKSAMDAAAKAKAQAPGYGVFDGIDAGGPWEYAGQIRVLGATVAQGYGVKTYKDGSQRYAGQWNANQPNGYGVQSNTSIRIEAQWSNGTPSTYVGVTANIGILSDSTTTHCLIGGSSPDTPYDLAICASSDGGSYAGTMSWSIGYANVETGVTRLKTTHGDVVAKGDWETYSGYGSVHYPDGTVWKRADVEGHVYGAKFDKSGRILEQGRYAYDNTLEKALAP
jgi:hypothetical protein